MNWIEDEENFLNEDGEIDFIFNKAGKEILDLNTHINLSYRIKILFYDKFGINNTYVTMDDSDPDSVLITFYLKEKGNPVIGLKRKARFFIKKKEWKYFNG